MSQPPAASPASPAQQPPPKKSPKRFGFGAVIGAGVAALVLGAGIGGVAARAVIPAPTPQACIAALATSDQVIDLLMQTVDIASRGVVSAASGDVGAMHEQTTQVRQLTEKAGPAGVTYRTNRDVCRSS